MNELNGLFEQRRRLLKGFAAAGIVGGLTAILPGGKLLAASDREEKAYQLGLAAYIYGYPLIHFARLRYTRMMQAGDSMNGTRHRYGEFVHRRSAVTPSVPGAPQTDTLYSNLWGDLRKEPLLIQIPPIDERYWSIEMCDLFGKNFAVPNRRTLPGGNKLVALVGPDWQGELPQTVDHVYRPASPQVFVLMRLFFADAADKQTVAALQDQFVVRPLSAYGQAHWQAPQAQVFAPPDPQADRLADFKALQLMLRDCPPAKEDAALVASFAAIGLGADQPADFSDLDEQTRNGLERAEAQARAQVIASTRNVPATVTANGWRYPLKNIGLYDEDYLYRATMTMLGLVALPVTETIYLTYQKDQTGQLTHGDHDYTVTFAAGDLPIGTAFWSLHAYRYDSGFTVIPNPIDRYAVGTRSTLVHNADGSLTIYLQSRDPGGEKTANWLPTQAGQPFFFILRGYEPTGSFAAMTWVGPKVSRA